jgi:hypothetical protein
LVDCVRKNNFQVQYDKIIEQKDKLFALLPVASTDPNKQMQQFVVRSIGY